MTSKTEFFRAAAAAGLVASLFGGLTRNVVADEPYKVVQTTQTMGTGRIDYVYADNDGRRLYVPRGTNILVFDLDTLKAAGTVPDSGGHGVAVDPESHHGFASSSPVTMFDTKTLEVIKKIKVEGGPDAIYFDPFSKHVFVLSHRAPNASVLDPKDGSIVGTIDLGGAPEQAASDEKRLFVNLEDQDKIAVVDTKTLKVTAHYSLDGKGGGPAGLGYDAKNHILFSMCHDPATCVVLNADDGKILATLPIGQGTDSGGFNPNTMEAFSSQGDGTLTIIKEKPTSFEVEQTVQTKSRAKTCAVDTKNNHVIAITIEAVPGATPAPVTPAPSGDQPGGRRRGGRPGGGPGLLDIIVIGK